MVIKNGYKLISELLKLSHGKIWDEAKLEWLFQEAYTVDEPETCLCGHFPIIEICVIYNKKTHFTADVGNQCVKQFIGLQEQNDIFNALRKISKDISKSVNSYTLRYALDKSWISQKDFNFYNDILRKRSLSAAQSKWKLDINNRIVYGVKRKKMEI